MRYWPTYLFYLIFIIGGVHWFYNKKVPVVTSTFTEGNITDAAVDGDVLIFDDGDLTWTTDADSMFTISNDGGSGAFFAVDATGQTTFSNDIILKNGARIIYEDGSNPAKDINGKDFWDKAIDY